MDKMKNEITKLEKDHETTNEKNKQEINLKVAEIEKLKKDQVEMKNVLEKVEVQTDKNKILKEKDEELNSEIEEHKKNMDKMKNEITKLEKDHETTNEKYKEEINLKVAEIEKLKKDQVEM